MRREKRVEVIVLLSPSLSHLVVRLCRRSILVVLLVHFTSASVGDGVSGVVGRGVVDGRRADKTIR